MLLVLFFFVLFRPQLVVVVVAAAASLPLLPQIQCLFMRGWWCHWQLQQPALCLCCTGKRDRGEVGGGGEEGGWGGGEGEEEGGERKAGKREGGFDECIVAATQRVWDVPMPKSVMRG